MGLSFPNQPNTLPAQTPPWSHERHTYSLKWNWDQILCSSSGGKLHCKAIHCFSIWAFQIVPGCLEASLMMWFWWIRKWESFTQCKKERGVSLTQPSLWNGQWESQWVYQPAGPAPHMETLPEMGRRATRMCWALGVQRITTPQGKKANIALHSEPKSVLWQPHTNWLHPDSFVLCKKKAFQKKN